MRELRGRLFLSFAAALLLVSGCLPVDVSHYGTARPVGAGNVRAGGGFNFPRDGGSGANHDQSDGAPVTTHQAGTNIVNSFDAYAAYGITGTTDLNLKLWSYGAEIGLRQVLVNTDPFKVSLGAYGGVWANGYSESSNGEVTKSVNGQGTTLHIPLTASLHAGDHFAVFFGPEISHFDVRVHHFNTKTVGNDVFSATASYWMKGGFAGIEFGPKNVEICVGATFYQEPQLYPIDDFNGDGFYAYPFVNATVTFGKSTQRAEPAPGPAVTPLPAATPNPYQPPPPPPAPTPAPQSLR